MRLQPAWSAGQRIGFMMTAKIKGPVASRLALFAVAGSLVAGARKVL
jgi:hypothetical protein